MAMPVTTLVSADELQTPRFADKHVELVAGVVRFMTPAAGPHGAIAAELLVALGSHVKRESIGRVFAAETGFVLARNPDTVRAPDAAFVSSVRIPPEGLPRGFVEGGPDVAVEVLSPTDSWSEMSAKVADYLAAGTRIVWVIDPRTRTVTEYLGDGTVTRLDNTRMLEGGTVLAGFAYGVAALFEGIA